ncbi:MAG: hypothetical protein WCX33_00940 [Candidatus Shapirobacteria bacterium]
MNKEKINTGKKDWKNMLVILENKLNVYFGEKAPKLPDSVGEFIVKYGPYFAVIGIIFGLGAILVSLGLISAFLPFTGIGYGYSYGFSFWSLFSLAVLVLQGMAIPGLFKRLKSAWNLMFYASLVSALSSLLSFDLGGLIIGMIISWYFLFQIRKYYK